MTKIITRESDFYFWLVEYLHQTGEVRLYPKDLVRAAELALDMMADSGVEDQIFSELYPGAHLCSHGKQHNQALGLAFYLALHAEERRPYSSAIINFLAECLRPPGRFVIEEAARVAFEIAGLHLGGCFREYRKKTGLQLETTTLGAHKLGLVVRLRYALDRPFITEMMRGEAEFAE